MPAKSEAGSSHWTFLTNHTHVLLCLAQDADQTLREVSLRIGITERAVQRIVADLEAAGVLSRERDGQRDGRRNRYSINPQAPLRHPLEQHCQVGALLELLASGLGSARQ